MTIATNQEWLTIAEAAELVRVSPSTIRRWIASGRLHPIRPGERTVRIARAELAQPPPEAGPARSRMLTPDGVAHTMPKPRVMSEEDRQRLKRAIELSERLRQEQRENYGVFTIPSWELLHEAREEHDRQLMGEE